MRTEKADPLKILLIWFAIAFPTMLAYNVSPSATFLNQAASLMGWGLLSCWLVYSLPSSDRSSRVWRPVWQMLACLAILVVACIAAAMQALPMTLALSSLGMLLAAALLLVVGGWMGQRADNGGETFNAVCIAFLSAGLLGTVAACVQTFAPEYAEGDFIAAANTNGRSGGNLRQPNHLSSLLLWALAGLAWLQHAVVERESFAGNRRLVRTVAMIFMAVLAFGLVLTVSRTGTLCIVLLALWGVVDKRLSRFARQLLWLLPVIYLFGWLGMEAWSHAGAHKFAGDVQLNRSDISSSRFGIWTNALWLIAHHPWFGVGWGEFNFAWSLTPFPGRPVAFFDHTHNLPLQFIVEMGIPLGILALGLIGLALWKIARACFKAPVLAQPLLRCVFVMVSMMLIHSMLEYPLWYAYFLLPTIFLTGLGLGAAFEGGEAANQPVSRTPLIMASVLLSLGALYSVVDYWRVVEVFSPGESAAPLQTRVARAQRSWFFAHHADYAAATTEGLTSASDPFKRSSHYLLDTRLMIAWARAFNERGDVDRARYIVERLREFRNPDSVSFLAQCDQPPEDLQSPPFQCKPPSKAFVYGDFK